MDNHIDLETFFKEQEVRMNLSDSDWESYEERLHQMHKRKREERKETKATSVLEPDGREHSDDMPSSKRARVAQVEQEHQSSDQAPASSDQAPTTSVSDFPQDDIAASSNHRKSGKGAGTTRVRKFSRSGGAPSEITSPASLERDLSNDFEQSEKVKPKLKGAGISSKKSTTITRNEDTLKAAFQAKKEAERAKKLQEQKEALMTPSEYASILQEKWQAKVAKAPPEKLFLKDAVVFLVFEEKKKSTKDTRIKLDIIARHGGQVATTYDPGTVTHIVPGGSSITMTKTLRALGLKSLADIPPDIHTVKWDWIVSGVIKAKPDSEIMHELYKERLAFKFRKTSNDSNPRKKGKMKDADTSVTHEHSVIEEFSVYDSPDEEIRAKASERRSSSSNFNSGPSSRPSLKIHSSSEASEDPLLPFYAKAREEAELMEPDDDIIIPAYDNRTSSKLKGFQCDRKGELPAQDSPNWDIIEKLAELREMHRDMGTDGDKWRVISYQKAIGSLKRHSTRIRSREEALKLPGISDKTADKIMEIIRTGELQRIKYTKTLDLEAIRVFSGIYGVGSNIARRWFNQGIRSLDDLRSAVVSGNLKLTPVQEIGLQHYDDINNRMPRQEAEEIFIKIKNIALSIDPKLSLEIMGSFRRGKETCGDIDILLTRPNDDGKTHSGVLLLLCNRLRKEGILTEDLALPENWHGLEATYRGLCHRDAESRRRRIDILCIPYEWRGAARIYYTGDDIFNRSIRLKANKMGMSLNQRGLFQGVVRDPRERTKKLCQGSLLCAHSEKKIFDILGVPWQEPHERVRS